MKCATKVTNPWGRVPLGKYDAAKVGGVRRVRRVTKKENEMKVQKNSRVVLASELVRGNVILSTNSAPVRVVKVLTRGYKFCTFATEFGISRVPMNAQVVLQGK